MTLDYQQLIESESFDVPCAYDTKDVSLYALGTGFASDPLDRAELNYVVDTLGTSTVPTMAATLAYPHFLENCGWNYSRMLHGEQRLELFRPLPAAADLLLNSRIKAAYDRGPERGAVIITETEARMKRDDTVVFVASSTLLARGDGGFGGPAGSIAAPHRVPEREPDMSCDLAIRPDQALLYRLTGDMNPLHADPVAARLAGFERPILHGLCSYGIACRAILQTICDYDFTLINGFDVRFSAPLYPGEVLTTQMWQDRNVVSFRCLAKERGVVVLNHGRCMLAS